MGVRGLATFARSGPNSLLEPHKLCRTTVIIDGHNFVCELFKKSLESVQYLFSGDYDYFYSCVIDVFRLMLKCGVNPILMFDGCQPMSKFKTIASRREQALRSLIKMSRGFQHERLIFPVLLSESFYEALDEIGIKHVHIYEEVDGEIAILAEHLKYPVLSNDTDFFIYDVDVIPLQTMDFTCREDGDGSLYIPCQLYRSGSISRMFPGLERSMLPMVSIIVGHDFVGKGFTHVFTGSNTVNFRDVFKALQTHNDRESVITKILQSLNRKEVERVERAIREALRSYDLPSTPMLSKVDVETQTILPATPSVYGLDLSGLPDKLLRFYESGKLNVFTLWMLRYRRYNLPIMIEDIYIESCHFSSIRIVREIYKILRTLTGGSEEIILNLRVKNELEDRKEVCPRYDCTRTVPLEGNVLEESEDFRRKLFFQSLRLEDIDRARLRKYDDDWVLFITSMVYWLRNTRKVSLSHLSAVLWMALSVYVKSKRDHRERGRTARPFGKLDERIPDSEYTKFSERFSKAKKCDADILARPDFYSTAHVFACLQSILTHVLQLNYLLGELLPGFLVSRFYSGTFLFNMFVLLEQGLFAELVAGDLPEMRGAHEVLEQDVRLFWRFPGSN